MNHRTFASAVVALVSLTGCNSLNTTTINVNRFDLRNTTQIEVVEAAPEPEAGAISSPLPPVVVTPPPVVLSTAKLCPLYRPPVLPVMPELPIKEIAAVGPGNPAKVNEIERKHIEDLRIYIVRVKEAIARSQAQYLAECRTHLKK